MIPKPFVNAAFVCERTLIEKDDAMSAIRIVDYFQLSPPAEGERPPTVRITVVVLLKSPIPLQGEMSVSITRPDGKESFIEKKWPAIFDEEVKSANLLLNLEVGGKQPGWTWIKILWDGEELTRTPILVTHV